MTAPRLCRITCSVVGQRLQLRNLLRGRRRWSRRSARQRRVGRSRRTRWCRSRTCSDRRPSSRGGRGDRRGLLRRSSSARAPSALARPGTPAGAQAFRRASARFSLVAREARSAFLNRPVMCSRLAASDCSEASPSSASISRASCSPWRGSCRISLTSLNVGSKRLRMSCRSWPRPVERDAELVDDHAETLALRLAHRVEQFVDVDRRACAVAGQQSRDRSRSGRRAARGLLGRARVAVDELLADQRLQADAALGVDVELLEGRVGDVEDHRRPCCSRSRRCS